ncbi:(Fe-S)-binding protein [Methylomicrobium lacus]|uniref:(Fe-S)-binding protein n=1 Tax=Methylomicrobium lacus TaxID=136992 RepID=UPI0035A85472
MHELLKDADLCVKCGLCLPDCPTYAQTGNENESPRGRIALIQGYAGGHLDASPALLAPIDHCLLCRACEKACPAEVPYGRLIDRFRARTRALRPFSPAVALLKRIAINPTLKRWAQAGLRFHQSHALKRLGLLRLLNLGAINRLLPAENIPAEPLKSDYPASGNAKGEVGLFTGCLGALLDPATLHAAIQCLTAAGFAVHIPAEQTCCGALAQHDGDADIADQLAKINGRAFAMPNLSAIVTVASGCGAQLKDCQNADMTRKVVDVSRFLAENADFSDRLIPLAATVCLHTPCSLKNVMREEQGALALLRQIPELKVIELPKTTHCCGAAGSYVLKYPEMADTLADQVLEAVIATQADTLITSNIGCALHLAAGLKERGKTIQALHPLVLLARQLP